MKMFLFAVTSTVAWAIFQPAVAQYANPNSQPAYDWREQRGTQDWRNNTWRERQFDQNWQNNNWRQQRANEDWKNREKYLEDRMPNNATDNGYTGNKNTDQNKGTEGTGDKKTAPEYPPK